MNTNDIEMREMTSQTHLSQSKKIELTLQEKIYLKLKSIKNEIRHNNQFVMIYMLLIFNILLTILVLYNLDKD